MGALLRLAGYYPSVVHVQEETLSQGNRAASDRAQPMTISSNSHRCSWMISQMCAHIIQQREEGRGRSRKVARQSQRYKLGGRHGHSKSMRSRHRPDVSVDYLRVPVKQVTLLLRKDCLPPSEDLVKAQEMTLRVKGP